MKSTLNLSIFLRTITVTVLATSAVAALPAFSQAQEGSPSRFQIHSAESGARAADTFIYSPDSFTTAGAAAEGTNSGGGGEVQRSTRKDLEELIKNRAFDLSELSDWYLVGPLGLSKKPLSPKLRKITSAVLGSSQFDITRKTVDYLNSIQLQIIDQPCIDDGQEKDACTDPKMGAPIRLSAPRLARYPRAELRDVILPLLFHEVAHQFGFGEDEAQAFQRLAALHLKYRTTFSEAKKAMTFCALATATEITVEQKREILSFSHWKWPTALSAEAKEVAQANCAKYTYNVSNDLKRTYDGNIEATLKSTGLTQDELALVKLFTQATDNPGFRFSNLVKALVIPDFSSYYGDYCGKCPATGVDKWYTAFLASKAAVGYMRHEVERGQVRLLPARRIR